MAHNIAESLDSVLPSDALNAAAIRLLDGSPQSVVALGRLIPKLGLHLDRARGIRDIRQVSEADVRAWIEAPLPSGARPALATCHTRRAAARLGFRILRQAGLVNHDPTADLVLSPREANRQARPLTDIEIRVGRAATTANLEETRLPAIWALAETTATTHEIPRVLPEHIHLNSGFVLLSGSNKLVPRKGILSEWAAIALQQRLSCRELGRPLVYEGSGLSPASMQASASSALARIMTTAGLRGDTAVKPGSVRAWAGRRIFEETGRIDAVARALGCKTLDSAALNIGFDWRNVP